MDKFLETDEWDILQESDNVIGKLLHVIIKQDQPDKCWPLPRPTLQTKKSVLLKFNKFQEYLFSDKTSKTANSGLKNTEK